MIHFTSAALCVCVCLIHQVQNKKQCRTNSSARLELIHLDTVWVSGSPTWMGGAKERMAPPMRLVPSGVSVTLKAFQQGCGNQPCVTSQRGLKPLTGALRQSGFKRNEVLKSLKAWDCFFCLEFSVPLP